MDNNATVKVVKSAPNWWTVVTEGTAGEKTVDDQIRGFKEVLRSGATRVCLDLTKSTSEFSLVHGRSSDILDVARGFQRVAVLVGDAKTAFSIKASIREPRDGFQVFYQRDQATGWLNE